MSPDVNQFRVCNAAPGWWVKFFICVTILVGKCLSAVVCKAVNIIIRSYVLLFYNTVNVHGKPLLVLVGIKDATNRKTFHMSVSGQLRALLTSSR